MVNYILVGGWPTPLKNMSSSVGMMKFPIYGKLKKCSKPPTSIVIGSLYGSFLPNITQYYDLYNDGNDPYNDVYTSILSTIKYWGWYKD